MADDFFFYSVCPFGATFSAYWFARLGGFLVRTLHLLLYISHMLALCVDDLLGIQDAAVVELTFSILLAFCCTFGIPISWPKLQLGFHVRWIGWDLHLRMGCVSIPADKLEKLVVSAFLLPCEVSTVIDLICIKSVASYNGFSNYSQLQDLGFASCIWT